MYPQFLIALLEEQAPPYLEESVAQSLGIQLGPLSFVVGAPGYLTR